MAIQVVSVGRAGVAGCLCAVVARLRYVLHVQQSYGLSVQKVSQVPD